MKVEKIRDNFYCFIFDKRKATKFGYNLYVMVNGNEAILIDCGFREHSQQVKDYFEERAITITKVIISHFHLDHINGLKVFENVTVIGSHLYQDALDTFVDKEQQSLYKPDIQVYDTYAFSHGDFNIKVQTYPGHSDCSIIIFINETYLHIGDELMYANIDEPVIPIVPHHKIPQEIKALHQLKQFKHYHILTSHGRINRKDLDQEIDLRLHYLESIWHSKEMISYEEAVTKNPVQFVHSEWHEKLYQD